MKFTLGVCYYLYPVLLSHHDNYVLYVFELFVVANDLFSDIFIFYLYE